MNCRNCKQEALTDEKGLCDICAATQKPRKTRYQIAASYNGKIVNYDCSNKKEANENFRRACQRVYDNLAAAGVGFVRDESGGVFEISRERKSARRVDEVRAAELKKLFEAK